MRLHTIAAPLSAVVGTALITNCVLFVMLVITVFAANTPVPLVLANGIPTRKFSVVLPAGSVIVEPLLLTPVKVGSLEPVMNFINTHAASQLLGADDVRQLFSQLRLNCTEQ